MLLRQYNYVVFAARKEFLGIFIVSCYRHYIIQRSVKLKKIQLRKIGILLVLSAMPSVYANNLSMTPLGVENPVEITISFTNSTSVVNMGFSSADDAGCSVQAAVFYIGGTPFPLGAAPPRVAYFNGYLPRYAADLCLATTGGTIALDGVVTDQGLCSSHTGCYEYTCDRVGGSITSITPKTPFTATCA